jgi:hypothetical protein
MTYIESVVLCAAYTVIAMHYLKVALQAISV